MKLITEDKGAHGDILTIEDLSHDGRGVGRIEGYTVFVPGGLPEEEVSVRIVKKKPRYGEAQLLEIIKESPDRQKPPCPVFYYCGGCDLLHLKYGAQVKFKEKRLKNAIKRIGGAPYFPEPSLFPAQEAWRYRNKGVYHTGSGISGFYARGSHKVVGHEDCLLQKQKTNKLKRKVDEARKKGILEFQGSFTIRMGSRDDKVLILPETRLKVDSWKEIASFLKVKGICSGDELLWGSHILQEEMGGLSYEVPAHIFFQVNSQQREVLFRIVRSFLSPDYRDVLLDVFAGTGSLSLPLAPELERIIAVEISPGAVRCGEKTAAKMGYNNVAFYTGKAENMVPEIEKEFPSLILLDPPRQGCHPDLLETLLRWKAKKVVYVSCNPATLARDMEILLSGGFSILEVNLLDMFPNTYHVETVVLMSRADK